MLIVVVKIMATKKMNKKYQIIYADPPWKYGSKSAVNNTKGSEIKKLSEHYPSMSTESISNLRVKDIIEEEACCFMWFTSAFSEDANKIMRDWGFKPIKIIWVWEKLTNRGNTCKNVGPWSMGCYEYVLFGTRGNIMKHRKKIFDEKMPAERFKHSQKPNIARERIEAMFPSFRSKLELFARQESHGWDAWGNEVKTNIIL